MVTTIEKPERQPERDLSKRLAAVVTADKNKPSTLQDDQKREKAEQEEPKEDKEAGKEEKSEVMDEVGGEQEKSTKEEMANVEEKEMMEVKKEGSVKNKKTAKKNKRAAKKEAQRNERALKEKAAKDQQQQEEETAKEEKVEGDEMAKKEKAEEEDRVKEEKSEGEPREQEAVEKEEKQTAMPAKDTAEEIEPTEKDKERWKGLLDQREKQLLQAMETIAKLHDQIHQLGEEATENEARWKSRIKPDAAIEELKRQLATKDEQIEGLLREGEKLSKVELKHSTTIKKLRQEKAEQEKAMAELTKKWEKAMQDGTQASEKAAKRVETERRLQDSVKLLTDLSEQQTKHINKLESDKLDAARTLAETERRLKDALDRIERARAQAKAEADQENAVVLEKEVKANDRLHKEFAKFKENAEAAERGWRKEQRDLQIALQATQEQAAQREDSLRKEVAELQKRCVEQEKMQFEMSVDESTAPLLRQMDELQTQHAIAIKNRDQTEQR
jgi:hypothetical protein